MNRGISEYFEPGKKNILLIYILYLLGTVIIMLPLIGAGLAFVHMGHKNIVWRTHYQFAFRTFVLGIIAIIASIILSFVFVSVSIFFIGFLFYIAVFVWFIVRSIVAIGYLIDGVAHPNPKTFWIK